MSMNRLDSKLLGCAALFGALSFAGCADTASTAQTDAPETAALETVRSTATLQAGGGTAVPTDGGVVPNPTGTYFVSVTPNGTGCPKATCRGSAASRCSSRRSPTRSSPAAR